MKPYIFAILAALTWGVVPIIEKMGLIKVPVWAGLFYRCVGIVIGIVILLIFKFEEIKSSVVDLPHGWYYLAIGGFLASIVGQVFFYHALKTGEASKVVPVAAMYPLISFILGIMFLSEKFTLAKAGGMALVITGVMLLK